MNVSVERKERVTVVTIERVERRNAVDAATAGELDEAFSAFDRDPDQRVAILTGAGGTFCAGADLQAIAASEDARSRVATDRPGPMGPTRRELSKPVLAAIDGHAVAGGLELACWCDLRIASRSAVFGVYCRRFGVPLVDGGTVRLPRLIGHSRAMDMILTGRGVDAAEALEFGLVNRLVDDGAALDSALEIARSLADLPQHCLRNDRRSLQDQWHMPMAAALDRERELGLATLASQEAVTGAERFARGEGRKGGDLEN